MGRLALGYARGFNGGGLTMRIVIVIEGGCLRDVYASGQDVEIEVCDLDSQEDDDPEGKQLAAILADRSLFVVY